jgi:hypothetical protein
MKNFNTNIIIGGKLNPSLQKAFDAVTKFASKSSNAFKQVNNNSNKLNRSLNQTSSSSRGLSTASNNANRLGRSLKNAAREASNMSKTILTAGAAATTALAIKGTSDMVSQASSMEQYRNTLNIVMKDNKKASETFKWAVDYANKTPFETADIVDGTVKLQSYGMEAQKVLPYIGDMASAMGKSMDQAVEAVADAQTGELERLKEFGITKEQIVKQANKKLGNLEVVNNKGQITNQRAFNAALMSLMKERFEGGMEVQAKSFKGVMSTISGVWKSSLSQMAGISDEGLVIDGSLFDVIKDKALQLSEQLQELQASGKFEEIQKSLGKFATSASNAVEKALPKIMDFGEYVANNGPQIMNTIKFIGIAFLTWKAISFVNTAITTISSLASMLSLAKAQYIPLLFAKIQDMALTAGIIGLYTWDAIVKGASAAKTFLLAGAQGALNMVVGLGTTLMSAFGAVMAFLTSPIGLVIAAVALLAGGFIYLWNTSETVRSSVVNFFSTLKQWGVDACNTVINALNKMIDLINKIPFIDIPNIPNVGGGNDKSSKGKVKKYARGGIISSPHYGLLGEAGPEVIIPLKKNNPRSIQLLNQTSRMLGVNNKQVTPQPFKNIDISNKPLVHKPLGVLKARDNSNNKNRATNTLNNSSASNYYFQPSINASGSNKDEIKEAMRELFEEFKEYVNNIKEDHERININEPIFSI